MRSHKSFHPSGCDYVSQNEPREGGCTALHADLICCDAVTVSAYFNCDYSNLRLLIHILSPFVNWNLETQ